jgi:lipopolysaccharide exporter
MKRPPRVVTEPEPPPPLPSEDDGGAGRGLARAAVGGAAWQGLSYVLGKGLTLVTTIVLARVLTPDDFGLAALALVFITYAEVITDLGVAQAVIYLPRSRRTADAALAVSTLWGLALFAGAWLTAPIVADFFGRPEVTPMFRAFGASLLVGGLGGVPDALLRKELAFRKRLVAIVGRVVVKGGVSISLAVAGAGPWALVWGYVAGEATWLVAVWALAGYRPGSTLWRLRRETIAPLVAYGLPAAGSAVVMALVFNVDYLIVGQRLGAEALGFYTIAYRIPELLILQALWVVSTVAFPLFSLVRDDPGRLERSYLLGTSVQAVYGAATGLGLAMVAPMLVPVVFGEQWSASIVPLEAIAVYAVFGSMAKSALDLYKGVGRPGLAVTLSLVRLILVVPALLYATRHGIAGVAWAQVATSFLMLLVYQTIANRIVGVSPGRFLRALVPAAALGVGVVLFAGAVRVWMPGSDLLRLVAAVAAGAAGGLALMWLADRDFVRRLRILLRRGGSPARQPAPT